MRLRLPVVAIALALSAAAVSADEISDQLSTARDLYQSGDVAGAVSELEFTIEALKSRLGVQYLESFPEPAAGWSVAEKPAEESTAAMPFLGGGTVLARTYHQEAGSGQIDATLMTGGSFLQGIAGMMMNPQVMAAQPNAKRIRIGRENAVLLQDSAAHTAQLFLSIGNKVSIMLDGKDLTDGEPLVDLATRWDLAKVKALAGL
jgi:hypothetical protein